MNIDANLAKLDSSSGENGEFRAEIVEKEVLPKQIANLSSHDLGEALLSVSKELWITKDRLRIIEQLLVEQQLLDPNAVKNYQPDEQLGEEMKAERERYLHSILRSLQPD